MRKFFIAGVQYHQLKTIVNDLKVGDTFDLEPDPENKYDPNAVKIMRGEVMCGYVPKRFSSEISAAIELGTPLTCTIVFLDPSLKPWDMCEVKISDGDEDCDTETDGGEE